MEQSSGKPGMQLTAEVLALSQNSAASQLSVNNISRLISRDPASLNIDTLIDQLITTDCYDGAEALAIAAGLNGLDVDARCLASILPLANAIEGLPLLICQCVGDLESVLLDIVEFATMAWERDAMVLLVLAQRCQDDPPKRLLGALRTLARNNLGPEACALLVSAVRLIDDPEVNKVADVHLEMASFFGEDALGALQRFCRQPSINDLPERDPATAITGRTLVREGAKVGRNAPCPCGSGKKYKKCCLGKELPTPSPAHPVHAAEPVNAGALGWKMTRSQFFNMRIQELCQQDLTVLPANFLTLAISRFCQHRHWKYAQRAIDELATRDDLPGMETLDDYRSELIFEALRAHQLDFARAQIALLERPDELDEAMRLAIKLHDPDQSTLQELNDYALSGLRQPSGLHGVDLAYSLLETFPALGIHFARGALSSERLLDSEVLLVNIEEARDALQLPAGDPGQKLFDRISEQGVDEHLLRHAEQAASQAEQLAVRETESVREQYQASRQRIEDLQATLMDKESRLKELLTRLDETAPEEGHESADKTTPSPNPDALRTKISQLKALLDQGNQERRALRRELLEATDRMVETSEVPVRETLIDAEEALEPADLALSKQSPAGRRFPVFSAQARKSLRKIPAQVVDSAMTAVADLTSVRAAGWSSVKRLKGARGIFSQRIGIHYRLLFSLDPAGEELIVQDLIHRRDLEIAIKHYTASPASWC